MNGCAPTYSDFMACQPGRTDIGQDRFDALLPDAEARVDAFIFPNSVDASHPHVSDYRKAVCAAVCALDDNPSGAVTGYTSGRVSEQYAAGSVTTPENAAARYLSGTGLLCRWL